MAFQRSPLEDWEEGIGRGIGNVIERDGDGDGDGDA